MSAALAEPPPTPPPTTDVFEDQLPPKLSRTPPAKKHPGSATQCLLPYIDPSLSGSMMSVVKSEAHPTSMHSDFLPADLLFTLKRQENRSLQATPSGSSKTTSPGGAKLSFQTISSGLWGVKPPKPPAKLWYYSNRRDRLKHLTDAHPCICGAGRDISFLYDNQSAEKDNSTKKFVPPDSIIPEEYRIVKHPGVLGLELHEDEYVAQTENHDCHMTIFPSTKPSGRHEVLQLKHTFDLMLQRAGVPTEISDSDLQGPTELHNLLELVEKEQTIYNIIFHELIRQVSVHCVERGELLADVRRRYANLLDRIPRQIKSLHNEVVAQRVLDRKLTNELKKFKDRIVSLTEELFLIKEHDFHVTEQSKLAEDNLSSALATSQRNSEMLNEYHELYELQRRRLEEQVTYLSQEQELWEKAAYDLSLRVAEQYSIQTVQRLQLSEKAWSKLASHFVILLSSKDTEELYEVQGITEEWKAKLKRLIANLNNMENTMREKLEKIRDGFSKWIERYHASIGPDGSVTVPSRTQLGQLWAEMEIWQSVINREAENFTGEALVASKEELKSISSLVEKWNDIALKLFSRHQIASSDGSFGHLYGADRTAQQKAKMLQINRAISSKLEECDIRLTGDNGVATGFVHLITPLETWDTKLSIVLTSTSKTVFLSHSDWKKFGQLLQQWEEMLEEVISYIGTIHIAPNSSDDTVEKEDKETHDDKIKKKMDAIEEDMETWKKTLNKKSLNELGVEVESWCSNLTYAVDNQDTKMSEEVSKLHSKILKWIVNLLLVLTHIDDRFRSGRTERKEEEGKKEEEEGKEDGKDEGKGEEGGGGGGGRKEVWEENVTHQRILSASSLSDEFIPIAEEMSTFSKQLSKSCLDVVNEIFDKRMREGYPNPEEERSELSRMENEVLEWTKLANPLIKVILDSSKSTNTVGNGEGTMSEFGTNSIEGGIVREKTTRTKSPADRIKDRMRSPRSSIDSPTPRMKTPITSNVISEGLGSDEVWEEEEIEGMNVIGVDDNIHLKSFQEAIDESNVPPMITSSGLGLATESAMPKGRGSSVQDAESLIILLDKTKESLQDQEALTKQMEIRAELSEKELGMSRSKVSDLEEELKQSKASLEQLVAKSSNPGSRASSKSGSRKSNSFVSRSSSIKKFVPKQ